MAVLELKGRMASLTRLRLFTTDLAAIRTHLEQLSRQMPDALRGMPIVLESDSILELPPMLELLRELGMQPLAVTEGALAEPARALGMAVLPDDSKTRSRTRETTPAGRKPARVVDQPVRSGQQVYAQDADLIVLAAVSVGAELIADGCVHAYAPMRGRAIAGAKGDETARVFCRKFEAELVAVAGVYAVAEQMQGVRGFPVQAFLKDGKLKIELMT
jgi:septum site-determining protein MinC